MKLGWNYSDVGEETKLDLKLKDFLGSGNKRLY